MPTIIVRNIPPDVYEKLRQLARANGRSIHSEVRLCIERSIVSQRPVARQRPDVEELIARARRLRELTAGHPISMEEITRAIEEGRP